MAAPVAETVMTGLLDVSKEIILVTRASQGLRGRRWRHVRQRHGVGGIRGDLTGSRPDFP
jgi:hypothetical protein